MLCTSPTRPRPRKYSAPWAPRLSNHIQPTHCQVGSGVRASDLPWWWSRSPLSSSAWVTAWAGLPWRLRRGVNSRGRPRRRPRGTRWTWAGWSRSSCGCCPAWRSSRGRGWSRWSGRAGSPWFPPRPALRRWTCRFWGRSGPRFSLFSFWGFWIVWGFGPDLFCTFL